MRTLTDNQLLEAWAARGSDPAFAELVRRYVDLVYSAALRQVGDPPLAEDVVQAVFLVLARKAVSLRHIATLAGWLYRSTRFVASRAIRAEARRRRHEQEAASMNPTAHFSDSEDSTWAQVAPLLDEAMAALAEADRNAVLLRFFQGKPIGVVGEHLGVTEDAAKKRVSRAVDKLRGFLVRRGVSLSVAALAGALTHSAVQAAPAALAAKAAAAATGAAASGVAAALAAAALRQMLWSKLRPAFGCGAVAVATLLLVKLLAVPSAPVPAPPAAVPQVGPAPAAPIAETTPPSKSTDSAPAAARQAGKVFFLHIRAAADNQPVSNAGVILDCWGQGRVQREASFSSNTNGLCEIPIPGVAFDMFRIWISAEGFVPITMDWKSYELEDQATSYTARLERGLTLAGVIQDEQGAPVGGVKVAFTGPGADSTKRENVALYSRASDLRSDASGHFVSHQMPAHAKDDVGVAVSHPDFAAQWLPAALPESLRTNWVVVLTRGLPLPGRVVSARDGPVSGATVLAPEPHGGAGVSAKSDGEGNFTLLHLPSGPTPLEVRAAGFQQLKKNVLVESNAAPVLLELEPVAATVSRQPQRLPIHLSGTVVDANSGGPVPRFKILLDRRRGGARELLGESRDGAFEWDTPLTFAVGYALEVNADGYEPQASSLRQRADGDQTFAFRLKPGGSLAGLVLQPDGQPATAAAVGLDRDGFGLRFKPPAGFAEFGGPGNETKTDARGLFSLKTMLGMNSLLVVHASGCAVVPAPAGTNLLVQLAAWGAIEGTVYVGATPAPGQTVEVGYQSVGYAQDVPRLRFDLLEKTGLDGRFRFDGVPPGNHTVYRYINRHEGRPGSVGFSHGEAVTVRPGENAQVTLGGKGRAVIGQFVLSPPLTNYDWGAKWIALVQHRPDLVAPRRDAFPNATGFFSAYGHYDAAIAKYYLEFRPDGSFRADDVLPGQYTLALTVTAPPADPLREDAGQHPGPVLGGVTNTVVVPPVSSARLDEPLDLGAIHVPVIEAPRLGIAADKR